tara:strand:- start:7680 stop:8003 length:324 start_codon:yes stop_codon:yes gene_type:complete
MGSVSDRGSKNGRFLRSLGFIDPGFSFAMLVAGSLQQDGALPSLIDHRKIPEIGARLVSLTLQHPEPKNVEATYRGLAIDRPLIVRFGPSLRYEAVIETPKGLHTLW